MLLVLKTSIENLLKKLHDCGWYQVCSHIIAGMLSNFKIKWNEAEDVHTEKKIRIKLRKSKY